ncbi:MAG: acyl-[acyl-carrier-protein]--UDP-N-acetylglucosamine O-acyltransferase [Acidocella sp. 20-57-95]|nr:MAG: acyl-[acyl-carrier-protein]--UDP-N-acetylglucosamine O-acyltransferase [Acidocella sp. 20-57-95]OYV59744.1 MAG: acyl-[acyl-carrier-protein]--UDP-N-acetylglucosamine O-acyltransferase [Acidocella sp. 21-58-7]
MVHPTAIVSPDAFIGRGVKIGPFCTVGPDVILEDGVELVSHVVVDGKTRIGAGAKLFPFCTVGLAPQDLKYKGEPTETVIGPRTVIREHCSIHRGTVTGTGITRIGADCLLMAVVHVAHDCEVGDNVIMSNNVVLGGHVVVGDRAIIGGAAALLQFVRVGQGAMVGGVSGVGADVIPYGFVFGPRARLCGLNIIGLRRRGLDKAQLHKLRAAYKFLFAGPGVFSERAAQARLDYEGDPFVADMLDFIAAPSRHGLITTLARATGEDEG